MDGQKELHKHTQIDFKIGDLVKYVRMTRGLTENLWQQITGVGIIVGIRTDVGLSRPIYDIMANDEVFDVLEVSLIESYTRDV